MRCYVSRRAPPGFLLTTRGRESDNIWMRDVTCLSWAAVGNVPHSQALPRSRAARCVPAAVKRGARKTTVLAKRHPQSSKMIHLPAPDGVLPFQLGLFSTSSRLRRHRALVRTLHLSCRYHTAARQTSITRDSDGMRLTDSRSARSLPTAGAHLMYRT